MKDFPYTKKEVIIGISTFLGWALFLFWLIFRERNELYIPSNESIWVVSAILFFLFLPSVFFDGKGVFGKFKLVLCVLVLSFSFVALPREFGFVLSRMLFSSSLDFLPSEQVELNAKFIKYHPRVGKDCPKLELLINGKTNFTCMSGLDYQDKHFFSIRKNEIDIKLIGKQNFLGFYGSNVRF